MEKTTNLENKISGGHIPEKKVIKKKKKIIKKKKKLVQVELNKGVVEEGQSVEKDGGGIIKKNETPPEDRKKYLQKKEEIHKNKMEISKEGDGCVTPIKQIVNEYNDEIKTFLEIIKIKIPKIIKRKEKQFNENELDILDDNSEETINQMKEELKRKQRTMKYGEIWQTTIGYFPEWENLGTGHKTECDLRKKDNSIIIELKNKYNTCNSAQKKDVERKLSNYKKNNPQALCIWGIINEKKNNKKLKEIYKINGFEIIKLQGSPLLSLIFTYKNYDYTSIIIKNLRNIINECR